MANPRLRAPMRNPLLPWFDSPLSSVARGVSSASAGPTHNLYAEQDAADIGYVSGFKGILTPDTLYGRPVLRISTEVPQFRVEVNTITSQPSFFSTITINGVTLSTSAADLYFSAGIQYWTWSTANIPLTSATWYPVTFDG